MDRPLKLPEGFKLRCFVNPSLDRELWAVYMTCTMLDKVGTYEDRVRVSPLLALSVVKVWVYDHWRDLKSLFKVRNNPDLFYYVVGDLRDGAY